MNTDAYVIRYTEKQRSTLLGELMFYRGDRIVMMDLPPLLKEPQHNYLSHAWKCKDQNIRQLSNLKRRGPRDDVLCKSGGVTTTGHQQARPRSCPPITLTCDHWERNPCTENYDDNFQKRRTCSNTHSPVSDRDTLERLPVSRPKLSIAKCKSQGPNDVEETIIISPHISLEDHLRERKQTLSRERNQVNREEREKVKTIISDHFVQNKITDDPIPSLKYKSPHYGCKIPKENGGSQRRPSILLQRPLKPSTSPSLSAFLSAEGLDDESMVSSHVTNIKSVHYNKPRSYIHSGRILRKAMCPIDAWRRY